jgi:hypothetical protein
VGGRLPGGGSGLPRPIARHEHPFCVVFPGIMELNLPGIDSWILRRPNLVILEIKKPALLTVLDLPEQFVFYFFRLFPALRWAMATACFWEYPS